MALVSLIPIYGGAKPEYSLEQFGADPTGVQPADAQIAAAFAYASAKGGVIRQEHGRFRLSGSSVVNFSCSAYMTGSTLVLDGWQGEFRFAQAQAPITYNSSNESTYGVLALFNSSDGASRSAGSSYLSGLAGSTLLNNNFVIYTTPQQMFQYRPEDGIITRKDFNRVYNRGTLEDPHKYGLGNNVNSVYALPIADSETVLEGFCFDMANATRYRFMLIQDSTRLRVRGWSIRNKPVDSTNRDFFPIEKNRCYDVIVEDFDDSYPVTSRDVAGSLRSSYCFSATDCMNLLYRNCNANGAGWGSIGNNDCSKITYERCKLSRIDFHKPYRTYLKVLDCDLGRDGVVVCGLGDLQIQRTRFNFLTEINGAGAIDGNVVSTRPDAGGFVDGDLLLRDVVLAGRFNSFAPAKGLVNGVSDDISRGPVAGSPVKRTLFNNVVIDNLVHASQSGNSHFQFLISCNRTNAVQFPRSLTLMNSDMRCAKSSALGVLINLGPFAANQDSALNTEASVSTAYTQNIVIDNVVTTHITIMGNSSKHNPRVLIKGAGNSNYSETSMLCTFSQRGLYELHGCDVEGFSFTSGAAANGPVQVQMHGGRLLIPVGTAAAITGITGAAVGTGIMFNGTVISGAFAASADWALGKNLAQYGTFRNCQVYSETGARLPGIQLWNGASTNYTFSPVIPVKSGNKLLLANGYSGPGTYSLSEATVPFGTAKSYSYLGGSNGCTCTFTDSTSSGAAISNITSPAALDLVAVYVQAS
ncbi:hypothetical protein [Enterobacter phage SDFMU_EhYP]|uniref:Uncharacterized protein n=1 Tax=Enterobacter phage SDFMU_EhYP TaxID=3076128 RepID=A0AA96R5U2_9CAUD|nr:hypothetical protein [Enterobacter phage SDFMU_EhYP]